MYCFYSIPPEWIEGDDYPNGIPYNSTLSENDKKLVAELYGSPQQATTAGASDQ